MLGHSAWPFAAARLSADHAALEQADGLAGIAADWPSSSVPAADLCWELVAAALWRSVAATAWLACPVPARLAVAFAALVEDCSWSMPAEHRSSLAELVATLSDFDSPVTEKLVGSASVVAGRDSSSLVASPADSVAEPPSVWLLLNRAELVPSAWRLAEATLVGSASEHFDSAAVPFAWRDLVQL